MSELLEAIELAPQRAAELQREGERLYQAACSYPPVTSDAQAEIYAFELLEIKDARAVVKAERLTMTRPMRAALDAANDFFNRADAPYESRELLLKGHLSLWQIAQRKAQEAAQRELEEAAQAERQRLREAAQRLEEVASSAVETAPEQAAALAQESAELRQAALTLVAPVVPEIPKLPGISHRGTWKLKLVDEEAVRAYVHTHPEFRGLFPYDPKIGDALARSLKGKLSIPGAEVQYVPVVAAGRGISK